MKSFFSYVCLPFLLLFACDAPPPMQRIDQGSTSLDQNQVDKASTPRILTPEELMKVYFDKLKTRDHKALKSLLKYPNHSFYLDEPSPMTDWKILDISELSSAEADTFQLKPNPIKGDYVLKIKQYTVDDYKKTSHLAEYIVRAEQRTYQIINRLEHPNTQTLFLKINKDGIDIFKELEVLAEKDDAYLLRASPYRLLSVNSKAKILDQLELSIDQPLSWDGQALFRGDSLYAVWNSRLMFEQKDSTKTSE